MLPPERFSMFGGPGVDLLGDVVFRRQLVADSHDRSVGLRCGGCQQGDTGAGRQNESFHVGSSLFGYD